MRQSSRLLLGSALALGAVLTAPRVGAQVDVNPPPPNVLLLVDTSGSMEYKSSSSSFPSCNPTQNNVSEKSRWIELVEVMTGSIEDYRCESIDRNGAGFNTEYSISGTDPPDRYYSNPYHRPMSKKCAPGPGTLPANAFDWEDIRFREYDDINKNCNFDQDPDGLLDDGAFRKSVRFGLMTFDTHADPKHGYAGNVANYPNGRDGAWSYFLGSSKQGKPVGCAVDADMEVGARNNAALPWEGRLMTFRQPTDNPETQNDRIQQVLLGTRPYGATPIAGMLDDAREFLWNDTTPDPLSPGKELGPKNDPFVGGGCRKNHVILLSDGEPNMDLRPWCEPNCPYPKPEDTALTLSTAAGAKAVPVFVIGFAVSNITLSNATNVDCKNLSQFDLSNVAGLCATFPAESQLQACCSLNRIAYNGGTTRAFFAADKDELRAALSSILSGIAAATSSRTLPVFASVPGGSSGTGPAGFRFYSSFKPTQFGLWKGILERQRLMCVPDVNTGTVDPTPQPLDTSKGDDFVHNVNSGNGPTRNFWTVVGTDNAGKIDSERSIRPTIGTDKDGIGTYGGTSVWGGAQNWNDNTPPAAMKIDGTTCKIAGTPPTFLTDVQCRDRHLKWLTGLDTTSSYSRCPVPGAASCNLIGDVFHSTPRVIARPDELLRDESYQIFALKEAKRHTVLYASTNDGFLHAFKVASGDPASGDPLLVDKAENNELWAFMPPAVLPAVQSEYPPAHQTLLDGVPVIQDVVAREDPPSSGTFKFERSAADAQGGLGQWRTILVQSFGGNRGGYFALDVTDPVPNVDPKKGPKFLWQLTEYDDGDPLFGRGGTTPLITTIFFDDGTGAKEVAVAILPGGEDPDPPKAGQKKNRKDQTPSNVDNRFTPRVEVPEYEDKKENHAARAITVVRLDTGEVIRSFRADKSKAGKLDGKSRTLEVDIDSPITGIPVAFPGTTGSVTDRVFVGDRDGTLWRMDLSATDPDQWKFAMFFDLYAGQSWDAGQPIATAPVLSVDLLGNVTVAVSTGEQDVLLAQTGQKNFAFSLLERLNAGGTAYESRANWLVQLDDGERVTGPISLFNGALYFTSYKPEASNSGTACGQGTSRVWGMDYLVAKTAGNAVSDLDDGGKPRMPDSGNLVQFIDNNTAVLANAGIIFGVGVTQMPSCTAEQGVTDSFFGSGTHTSITSMTPGKFQLVMHTSGQGNVTDGSQTERIEIDLPTPPSTSRIDSWAALVE